MKKIIAEANIKIINRKSIMGEGSIKDAPKKKKETTNSIQLNNVIFSQNIISFISVFLQ